MDFATVCGKCAEGDFESATHLLGQLNEERIPVFLYEFDTLTLLHVAAREHHLEVCKRLLSPECKSLWPNRSCHDYLFKQNYVGGHDALDFALSSPHKEGKLAVVRFLISRMRTKKGKLRENYIKRINKGRGFEYLLLDSLPTLEYVIQVSLEFEGGESNSRIILSCILDYVRIMGKHATFLSTGRDAQLADVLVENIRMLSRKFKGVFEDAVMARTFATGTGLELRVALTAGWVNASWELLLDMLKTRWFSNSIINFVLCKLRAVPLPTSEIALEVIVEALKDSYILEDCLFNIVSVVESSFRYDHFLDNIARPVAQKILNYNTHSRNVTLFLIRYNTTMTLRDATVILQKSESPVFYTFHKFRTDFLHPSCLGKMLASGSQSLIFTLVWESDSSLTQMMCALMNFVSRSFYCFRGSLFNLRQRFECIREMYNVRILLKGQQVYVPGMPSVPSLLLTPGSTPLPRRAGMNILAFGWLGEQNFR
jgi:hypothetical protein